jgi:2-polyprenyl-3-methyl-5-hydroxy-6-metoxy-1,4-benzoquinol methylase
MEDDKMDIVKLCQKKHWDARYNKEDKEINRDNKKGDIENHIKRIMNIYAENYFWNGLVKNYLPENKKLKAIEIGSAPGYFLIKLNREMGYIPYGIEYSNKGAELNKKLFSDEGIDHKNIFHGDFFSAEFQREYKDHFDVVISRGFIEHFENIEMVIDNHINLLKSDGYLIVSIPNFSGFNLRLLNFFNKELVKIHNLSIMNLQEFKNLFKNKKVSPLFINYYGGINFQLFGTKKPITKITILYLFKKLQIAINIFLNITLKCKYPGCFCKFSPYLIFIGKKDLV